MPTPSLTRLVAGTWLLLLAASVPAQSNAPVAAEAATQYLQAALEQIEQGSRVYTTDWQALRTQALAAFKKGTCRVLVATDIAARGIDVPSVGHVINYDVPEDPNVYFHRIGRTARAGAEGKAISLVSQDRVADFERILAQTKLPIRKLNDEMGIAVPVATASSAPRYRRSSSYGGGGGGD